ncbi:MAG: DUF58 domain-containing protein [Pirellulaceae bacterium]|nr:DUF58 domain-containing protein [Pirellulaceae bacterium]
MPRHPYLSPIVNESEPLLSPETLGRLERLELVTRKIFRGQLKGERRSRRKGQSVEFADYRNYVAGDDLRFIDWNMYARFDKLFLRLYQEEEDLHFFALLDSSPSMMFGEPTKFRFAQKMAAALGYIGLCRSDRIKVEVLTDQIVPPSAALRGKGNLWKLLRQLETLPTTTSTSLDAGVKKFCIRNPGKGIVVLLSDLMDKSGYENAIRALVARQYDVYVIQIFSPAELEPDLTGDLQLIDCEDGDLADISVSPRLMERYKATLQSFVGEIRHFCARRGIVHTVCSTAQDVDQLVASYLRSRGLVR